MIQKYTGFTFAEILDLNICDYLQLRRDAYISLLSQSEEGREYLQDCWRFTQTEPDRDLLREQFKA